MFESTYLKVLIGVEFTCIEIFGNGFNFLVMKYEKFGGDPLKRTVNNRLMVQVGLAMTTHNLIYMPIYAYRIYFGPVYSSLAAFISMLGNFIPVWSILALVEMSLTKFALVFKWTFAAHLDEDFQATFLLFWNLGLAILSQAARFILGTFHQNRNYQIFSGNLIPDGETIGHFWVIFLGACMTLFLIATISVRVKKIIESHRDQAILGNINVVLPYNAGHSQYNTSGANPPILSNLEHFLLALLVISTVSVIFFAPEFWPVDELKFSFYFEMIFMNVLYKIVIPSIYLACKKDVRDFCLEEIKCWF